MERRHQYLFVSHSAMKHHEGVVEGNDHCQRYLWHGATYMSYLENSSGIFI